MSKPLLSLPWLTLSALFSRFIVVMVITAHTPIFVSGTEIGRVSIHCDVSRNKYEVFGCLDCGYIGTTLESGRNRIQKSHIQCDGSQQIQVKFGWKNVIQVTFESSVSVAGGFAWSKKCLQKMCKLCSTNGLHWRRWFWREQKVPRCPLTPRL